MARCTSPIAAANAAGFEVSRSARTVASASVADCPTFIIESRATIARVIRVGQGPFGDLARRRDTPQQFDERLLYVARGLDGFARSIRIEDQQIGIRGPARE